MLVNDKTQAKAKQNYRTTHRVTPHTFEESLQQFELSHLKEETKTIFTDIIERNPDVLAHSLWDCEATPYEVAIIT